GETSFGLHLGQLLINAGHSVVAAVRPTVLPLVSKYAVPYELIPDQIGPLLSLVLDDLVTRWSPDTIIFSDIATTVRALELAGANVSDVFDRSRIIGVDTWDAVITGEAIDIFGDGVLPAPAMLDSIGLRLLPVPMLVPDNRPGICRFMPKCERVNAAVRR